MINNKSLVLHPLDCNEQADIKVLIDTLQRLKFIESPLDKAQNTYLAGDDFLQLVVFLGCSPSVELAPTEEGKAFCHVRLLQPEDAPQLISSKHTNNPRCPSCRKEMTNTKQVIEQWQKDKQIQWSCPDCDFSGETSDLNWRHSAGVASCFIEVNNIFPNEAVPSDELMSALQKVTNSEWDYFYYHYQ